MASLNYLNKKFEHDPVMMSLFYADNPEVVPNGFKPFKLDLNDQKKLLLENKIDAFKFVEKIDLTIQEKIIKKSLSLIKYIPNITNDTHYIIIKQLKRKILLNKNKSDFIEFETFCHIFMQTSISSEMLFIYKINFEFHSDYHGLKFINTINYHKNYNNNLASNLLEKIKEQL